jgi:hypothetical protein
MTALPGAPRRFCLCNCGILAGVDFLTASASGVFCSAPDFDWLAAATAARENTHRNKINDAIRFIAFSLQF